MRSVLRRPAAALAPLVLLLACSAGAPAPPAGAAHPSRPTLPRLSWSPRRGAAKVDCSEPSYDCDKVGLEKCESECASGEMPDCVALALSEDRGPAKGGNPARGLALLRLACDKGFGLGCVALAAHPGITARDRATITAALAPACARGELCGCSLYGVALTLDPPGEVRGIELLGDSCGRGAIDACDSLALVREICERDHAGTALCARIRADLRPPWSPPPWPGADFPASLRGCFRVAAQVETPEGERCPTLATAKAKGWSTERGAVCPEDGSFEPGALYCFQEGRYFVKPPGALWDAHPASWAAPPDHTVFRLLLEQGHEGGTVWLRPDQGYLEELRPAGAEILAIGDGVAARLERLSPPDEQAARRTIAALPALEDACDRADRCSRAVHSWTGERFSRVSLRACLEQEIAEREAIEKQIGRDGAKEACP
ncbi:MAG: hypothetical protein ABJE95_14730 [Byssovorax sp.]